MALYTGTNTFTCTDNSTAQACIDYIDNAITSAGFVQTATSGQQTSVSTFASGSVVDFGFREYEINDSLTSTLPLYIRVHFGTATQGNTPTAGFHIRKIEAFMALSGTTPIAPIEMPVSVPSVTGQPPTAIPCNVHVYKRDGLAVLIFGGMVTSANGGYRQMGAAILRRSAIGGAFLLFPPTRPFGPGSYVGLGYAHTTPTTAGAAQSYVNCPAGGFATGATTGVEHATPLILGDGTGYEVITDLVICENVLADHYALVDMAVGASGPTESYRLLPHVTSSQDGGALTSNQQCVPWVVSTVDRYAFALAYLP